jgi:hypothetical protein
MIKKAPSGVLLPTADNQKVDEEPAVLPASTQQD